MPQGSILGVFLFNVTTDDLEDGAGADVLGEEVEDQAEDDPRTPQAASGSDRLPGNGEQDSPVDLADRHLSSSPGVGAVVPPDPDLSPVRVWRGLAVEPLRVPSGREEHPGRSPCGDGDPARGAKSANLFEMVGKKTSGTVSYTHLTLPTTPYV